MKRILVYMNSFNVGGVTSVAKSIYRNLDRTKFQMDFIRREGPEKGFDREIKDKGDRVFCFRDMPLSKIPIINYFHRSSRIIAQLEKLLGKERYDVIHIHARPSIALLYAKRAGIPQIIMHAHEAVPDFGDNVQKSMAMNMLWKYRQHLYKTIPTVKAGDSLKACVVKYGEEVRKDPRLTVLHPSIDPSRFDKRLYDKESIIKQFRINTNAVNLIHVGRLSPVKNQLFLVDIVHEINKERPCDLYIVGGGHMHDAIMKKTEELGLLEHVHILPPDTTPGLYLSMDCSVLPSLSEAFGMVAVESQIMGVPCFASTGVPEETNIGMCQYLDLGSGAHGWAERILSCRKSFQTIDSNRMAGYIDSCLQQKVEALYEK
jgi:glycosyltransferase involved in cell wall biosynthesis